MNNRRNFLLLGGTAAALTTMQPFQSKLAWASQEDKLGKQHLAPKLVQEFVSNAHTNLDRTKQLIEKEPKLIRANYEWAPGDFESGIDAAAHSGSVEIVEFLLSQGASYSIFVAAVLGHLETVKAAVAHNSKLVNCKGPHGIGLLQHALSGGQTAKAVAEYLKEQGADPDEKWLDLDYDNEIANFATGRYQIARGERKIDFAIKIEKDRLYILAGKRPKKRLQYQGQMRFAIEGTPAELLFERGETSEKNCQRVLLKEGFPVGFAKRIGD